MKRLRVPASPRRIPLPPRVALALLLSAVLPASAIAADLPALLGDRAPEGIRRTMLQPTPVAQQLAGLLFLGGYEAIGQPVALTPAQRDRLTAALRAPGAFDGEKNDEVMRPGVAYRFGAGADFIDLLVCFSCDRVAVVPANAAEPTALFHLAQPTREALLDVAKEALPTDEAIQELPRIRGKRPVPPPPAPTPVE